MLRDLIIWGATGQCKVLHEFIQRLGFNLVAVFDNKDGLPSPLSGIPIFYGQAGFERWLSNWNERRPSGLVAIGGSRGRARVEMQTYLAKHRIEPVLAVHPAAYVAETAILAPGCQILAHATVGTESRLGDACIVNTSASVDHECVLGRGVHIGPGATLAGCVSVGDYSFIGTGAVVLPRIHIGEDTIIGAGAVVTRDVPAGKVAYGNPAQVVRDNNETLNTHAKL